MAQGTVKWFNAEFRVLEEGQSVEFTVGAGQKGPQAESVRPV
jgi:CspA family cold shock protein